MSHRDVLEMELVLIEHWDMLYAATDNPSEDEICARFDRETRRVEILHLLGMMRQSLRKSDVGFY